MPTTTSKPRLLLVDDERSVVDALALRLRGDFEVKVTTSAAAALEAIRHDPAFAVVMVDIRMPDGDGNSLLARIRELDERIVRMVLTGHADTDTAIRAINEGRCFRFLCKPCPFDTLRAALQAAVEQYRLITSDRELIERRLAEMSQLLARSERLATLGSMAATVGHELANIAAGLAGVLDLIEGNDHGSWTLLAADRDDLERIHRHMSHFARQLLNMGRGVDPSPHERLDLAQAARDVLGMLTALGATKGVHVALEAPSREVPVLLSRTELEQVLVNLVRNAADALEDAANDTKRIWLRITSHDGQARCSVTDNGPGIAPEHIDQIFEPYFTTKTADRGTGLGLPVVRRIVEAASGNIEVYGRPGGGTEFLLSFPVAA